MDVPSTGIPDKGTLAQLAAAAVEAALEAREPRLLSIPEVSKRLKLTESTFRRWMREDEFPLEAIPVGTRYKFREIDVERYVQWLAGEKAAS